jgi:hypothetical protein
VSFLDVLIQFLNLNQIAVEESCRTAWRADQQKWTHLGDRIRRREPGLDLSTLFREFPPAEVAEVVKRANKAKEMAYKSGRQNSTGHTMPKQGGGAQSSRDTWRQANDRKAEDSQKGKGKGKQDKPKGQSKGNDRDSGSKKKFPHQMK